MKEPSAKARYLLAGLMVMLAVVLVLSSIRTFGELDRMRSVYLRSRAAQIATNLESLSSAGLPRDALDRLSEEEPALVDLQLFDPGEAGPDGTIVASIASGQELFRTVESAGVFRVYVPFHSAGILRVARIDLARSAADFLLEHARHNVAIAGASGAVLVLLSLYLAWSGRRAARLERQRLELEHMAHLGKMSAVLAHEIRNPLGTIKGFVQLAGERAQTGVKALLDPVLEEVLRLEKLVNDLLAYGRPRQPELRPVSWRNVSEKIAAHALAAIGARPVRFAAAGDDFSFRSDPDLLEQVLLNLVRNSIDAVAESGGEVWLKASDAGVVCIEVEDNGPGLPAPVRERLFEPFQTTKASGTGLGLSIARKLTESLGGRLELTDVQPHGLRAVLTFKHGNNSRN